LVFDGHDPIVHRDAQHYTQAAGHTFSDVMAFSLKGHEGGGTRNTDEAQTLGAKHASLETDIQTLPSKA
jgi:hypothetical protein